MAEAKKQSWTARLKQWMSRLTRIGIAAAAIALLAALGWWYWSRVSDDRPMYEVYSMTLAAGDDRNAVAAEIKAYVTETFPAGDYEYLGIIAQRMPTTRQPSTTTYVLFRRK